MLIVALGDSAARQGATGRMRIVLVRHAAVATDPAVLPMLWQLSDAGRAGARRLARERVWAPIGRIFSSPESKAFETAHILAGPNGITVTAIEDLHEVQRPAKQWFGDEYAGGYSGAVRAYFAQPDRAVHGWEPARDARARMLGCLGILREWEPYGFAVAGHGLTLSLLVSAITGLEPTMLWPTITLPDFAVLDTDQARLVQSFGRWQRRVAADDATDSVAIEALSLERPTP